MILWAKQQENDRNWYKMHINKNIALHLHCDYFWHIYDKFCTSLHGKSFTSALEIGTSDTGGFLAIIPRLGKRVAIDSAVNLLRKMDMLPLSTHIQYRQGFAENLPYKSNRVPFIIISNAIDHCKDMQKVADEITRVLKPGGYLLLNTFLRVKKPHPWTFANEDEVKSLFPSLKIIEEHLVIDERPFTKRNDAFVVIFQK